MMQDDDAYEMCKGNFDAVRGRYPEELIQEWAKGRGTEQHARESAAVQGAEHRTSQELFGALAATFHAPPDGSHVTVRPGGGPDVGSAFVRSAGLTRPEDVSGSESQSTSPTPSSQS
jgi:hypothetical protein